MSFSLGVNFSIFVQMSPTNNNSIKCPLYSHSLFYYIALKRSFPPGCEELSIPSLIIRCTDLEVEISSSKSRNAVAISHWRRLSGQALKRAFYALSLSAMNSRHVRAACGNRGAQCSCTYGCDEPSIVMVKTADTCALSH
jgi:hypothetical protein